MRTVAVTLLIALQLILQPAAVLAAVAGAGGPMERGDDCSGCCAAPAAAVEQETDCCSVSEPVESVSGCCCHGPEVVRTQAPSDAPSGTPSDEGIAFKRACNCATPPGSVPLAPRVCFQGTAAAGAGEFWAPLTALPGVIEVERFGVHGIARARAPGTLCGLNLLHQVYRI